MLAALEAGEPEVATYATPLGPRPRSARAVHRAMVRLRDPDERIQHEIWWETPARGPALGPSHPPTNDAWPHASAAWGWRPR